MTDPAELAADLARHLPPTDLAALADAAAAGRLAELRATATSPLVRHACTRLANCAVSPEHLAGLVAGAAATAQRRTQVQVLWTGPQSDAQTGRLTGPAIAELIDEATAELLIASYATYADDRVTDALRHALDRGVEVTALLERHADNPAYSGPAETFSGLPLRRWAWPAPQRPAGASMHAKVIVVDRSAALVGSANLTGRALDHNLECGVLIRGGPQPGAIRDHLWELHIAGGLVKV